MNIEEAIEVLKSLKSSRWFEYAGDRGKKILSDEEDNAIDTVLRSYNAILTNYNALEEDMDKQYNKGYQDGFHSAKYDKYMNEIRGEGESAVKYLAIEKGGYLRGYADGFKQAKFDCEMDKLDGR